jgi:asparagine synthase (glutamine-hydrolysing)
MPGIVGIISRRPAQECEAHVKTMIASMHHEVFYKSGACSVPQLGIYGGWIGLENSASQISSNEQKNIILIFSGECYLDSEVATGQKLIQLYEQFGERLFEKLNGLFSGLLIDQRQSKTFLFNDRYGSQRIYFYESDGDLYFASEAKALLRILPELREFNPEGITQFLTFGCTLDWRTIFRDIHILPGGSLWTFENDGCRKEKYFSPETWETQPQLSAEDFENKFQETFKKILPRYFSTDSKTGIALTGGLDTRMIMACRPQNNRNQTSYTFAGETGKTLDDKIAARVAEACGLEHKLLRLRPDFFSNFAAHADKTVFATDGCFGISGAHEIYFNRQARELATTRLTGNYGSEVFRGISTFKPLGLSAELFNPDLRKRLNLNAENFSERKEDPMSFAVFKEIPWNLSGSLMAGRSQVSFRTPYLDNELVCLAYQSPQSIRKSSLPASRLVKAYSKSLNEIPTDRGYSGDNSGLKFLCRRIFAEATFKTDYYNNEGLPRPLAAFDPAFKFVASKLKLAGLHKYLHYNNWYRHALSDYLQSALTAPHVRQSRFWNPAFVDRMGGEHIAGRKNHSLEINAVLTLEAVERLLFRELPRNN